MGGESSKAICLEESHVCVYTSQTRPSPNIFYTWRCDEERVKYFR